MAWFFNMINFEALLTINDYSVIIIEYLLTDNMCFVVDVSFIVSFLMTLKYLPGSIRKESEALS